MYIKQKYKILKKVMQSEDNKSLSETDSVHLKAETLTPYKAKVLRDVKEAVEELNLIRAGKLKARDAEELFIE